MAESLPPESDNKNPSAGEEELVQIGAHSTVFPPPEEAPSTAESAAEAAAVVSVAAPQTSEHDEMSADQTAESPATSPAGDETIKSATVNPVDDPQPISTKRESYLLGCLHDVLLILISALLGGALVLGVLLFLNGTLDMRGHDSILALNSYQETLSDNLSTLTGRVNAHEETLNALDQDLSDNNGQLEAMEEHVQTLDGQIENLDGQMQALDVEMRALDAYAQALGEQVQDLDQRSQTTDITVTTVREEVVVLNQEVADLAVRSDNSEAEIADINQQMAGVNLAAERFDTFTEGLRALAESLSQPDSASPEPEISSTEPVTVSITITTTETIAAAEPITPTVSLPMVGNQVDAGSGNSEDETAIQPTTEGIPSLTLFPPLEALPDLTDGQSHIFGLVWDDLNSNGQPGEGEIPIPSVNIILRDARGNVVATTTTDTAGRYLFANIEPGVYIVEETDPADVVTITSNLVTVTVPAGSMVETNFADQY